ncbi:MAG: hypothetical protein FWC51_01210 [Proteobacteria bacterium]|nr:hypothetical protein [Pseudomonadota bacterium]
MAKIDQMETIRGECAVRAWRMVGIVVVIAIAAGTAFWIGRYFKHDNCIVIHSSDMEWLESRGQHERSITFDNRGCIRHLEFYDTIMR